MIPSFPEHTDAAWLTHYEKSGCSSSPAYNETIAYFNRFAALTPYARMLSIGTTAQGRELHCLVVAKDKDFSPRRASMHGKAIVLIQNGIHPGEIEGKDATMLLLREITVSKRLLHLLDNLVLLVIPVLSADGHERLSPFNRPNQNGPMTMGWRVTANNLNLNRDYLKAETPEMHALLRLFSAWLPDFYIDNHTTNGADYQYHITYCMEHHKNIYGPLGTYGEKEVLPAILRDVEADGFLTAPYIEAAATDIFDGIADTPAPPRLSNGYAAVQNRLALLVETHSLKPFSNRVESTYSMNLAALRFLNSNASTVRLLNRKADTGTIRNLAVHKRALPLDFELTGKHSMLAFKGFATVTEDSLITGAPLRRYTSEPQDYTIPLYNHVRVTHKATAPLAYGIPVEFRHLVRVLKLHGIAVSELQKPAVFTLEKYRFRDVRFAPRPYEGRLRPDYSIEPFTEEAELPAGTFYVPAKQRAVRVLMHLLEPMAPDSFARWGFFNAFFERKEYAEDFIMAPLAEQMLASDPALRAGFEALLNSDEAFAADPAARLDFFYRRSPYFDQRENIYPVFRVIR